MHTSPSRATWSRALVLPSRSLSARFARALAWALLPVVVLFAVLGAEAKIGAQYQLLLGNPSNAVTDAAVKNNYLIVRDQFAISYNDSLGQPNWVSWNLTSEDRGSSGRTDAWSADPLLPAGFYRVQPTDYNDPGLSRGHMCPSADRTVTAADNTFTFLMSNMVPQTSHNNGGVWNNFEIETRNIAAAGNEVLVISGPSGFDGRRIASGVAAIPSYVWKVVVVVPVGATPVTERITTNTRVIAIKVPNVTSGLSDDWRTYLTSVNQIQQDTGLTFFTALPAQVASVLRTMIDGQPVVGAPVIETNPADQSVAAGGSVTFSVTASGNAPLTYQWTFEGEAIANATSATLTLNNVQLEHMGSYRVVVTNSVSTATSNPALLTVTGVAPVFLNEPMSQTANAGTNVVFSALAGGSPTLTYQWRKGGVPIEGATGATLTLTNVQAAAAGDYDVVATNSAGSATGGPASLEVTPSAPVILTQPATTSVGLNGTVTFTVAAIGTEPLAYVWRKGGVPIEGNASATTATLVLANVDASAVGSYDVVITNSVGTVTSAAAGLTISSFSNGALNYTGGTYAQNFDTLTGTHGYDSDTAVSIAGNGPFQLTAAPFNGAEMGAWWMAKYDGTGANARYKIDNGSAVNGAIYSFGTIGAADRALGSVGSGSTRSRFGMILNNNSGQTLTEFTVTYVGEQWREGNSSANTLAFSYAVDAADLNTGSFVSVAALNFTAPVNNPVDTTGAVLDGNAAANRRTVTGTVTGLVWPAGTRLVLRWTDADDINNDDGLAIDDFVFTAANAGPVAPAVVSTTPAADATGISPAQPITVTFNQPVTLAADWFTLTSATQGALAATVSGGPTTYTITPTATLPVSDTITVNLPAARVTEQGSGTLTMNEDYSFAFTTVVPVAPTIATHPAPQTVTPGGTATFTVGVNGTAPFSYQWRKGGQNLAGNASATTATLTLTNVQAGDAGSYDVVVSNLAGNVTSNAAPLTVSTTVASAISWNFGLATSATGQATPTSSLPAGVTGGTWTQGNNNGTTAIVLNNAVSTTYAGASGAWNAAAAARVGAYNPAAGGSAYFEFTLTPEAGKYLVVTGVAFGSRRTSTGPQAYAFYTSVDNYTTPVASGALGASTVWTYFTPGFASVSGAPGTPVTFRLFGFNGAGSASVDTANWRVDDFTLSVAVEAVPPPSGFGTWLAEHFTEQERADPQISGPDAKLTPDGLTNLMKYALGFAPRGPVGALPEPATADNDWTYTYTRPAERPDLIYTVQVSTNLVDWSSDGVEHVQVATADGQETWRARHAGGAKLFFRLKVERP